MEKTPIWKLLLKLSPPVMLALLIQSIYNIVDSFFVAKFSLDGLNALSIIFPIQLLMTALATGTGAGINILVARMDGTGEKEKQQSIIKSGLFLGIMNFIVFAVIGMISMDGYYKMSSDQAIVWQYGKEYATIIFLFSLGMFVEANCTKILQAKGNMLLPMYAQVIGAIINIVLDPLLIFGGAGMVGMGIRGAAIATVIGQWMAMFIVFFAVIRTCSLDGAITRTSCIQIYLAGLASMVMQSLYTLYIIGLNLILKQFSEDAVTVLGIYYKLQTFFFIPLMGLQQVILPIVSFNYGARRVDRVRRTVYLSTAGSALFMLLGTVIFMIFPKQLISIFTGSESMIVMGSYALRVIAISFVPAAFSMILNVYFQGVELSKYSIAFTILRQVILFVPVAWLLHFAGLAFVWWTFPITESVTATCCLIGYRKKIRC